MAIMDNIALSSALPRLMSLFCAGGNKDNICEWKFSKDLNLDSDRLRFRKAVWITKGIKIL